MSNSLFGLGLSGINAAQYGLTTTGQNISNSSTAGYTRESVMYKQASGQYTGSGYVGSGVEVSTVQRAYSQALSTQLNSAQSTASALSAYQQLAASLDSAVGDPSSGIGAQVSTFLSDMQALASSPSDASARQTLLGAATTLSNQLGATAAQMEALRSNVNSQLGDTVDSINSTTSAIASLNAQIAAASASGQSPNQLLDERDQQVASLSKLVNVNVVTQSDGSYGVFIGSGQSLVLGSTSYALAAVSSPSDASEQTVAYQGNGGATQYLPEASLSGGTLGGLLAFRNDMLDPAQDQLGAIATAFASAVNAQNALGLDQNGAQGAALFGVGTPAVTAYPGNTGGATLQASISDASALSGDSYRLAYDGAQYTLTDVSTGKTAASTATLPITAGGVSYTLEGSMNAGDQFNIAPTRNGAGGLSVLTQDSTAIAAAAPVALSAATGNTGTGSIALSGVSAAYFAAPLSTDSPITLSYDASTGALSGFPSTAAVTVTQQDGSTQTYAAPVSGVPYSSGATLAFGGVMLSLSGTPEQGDSFTVARNTALSGDGSNASKLGALGSAKLSNGTTVTTAYANYVNQVGTLAARVEASSTTQATLVTSLTSQQQSVSGVSLDEEAANLLQYQQLYQASSKVIQTASDLFDTILGLAK